MGVLHPMTICTRFYRYTCTCKVTVYKLTALLHSVMRSCIVFKNTYMFYATIRQLLSMNTCIEVIDWKDFVGAYKMCVHAETIACIVEATT